jgi:transcriptional regulator with XRE-family HTH domain
MRVARIRDSNPAVPCRTDQVVTRGWSQEQLAERASMQRSYLADLERGSRNPSVRTLVKLANAFGVPVATLLDDDTNRRKSRS